MIKIMWLRAYNKLVEERDRYVSECINDRLELERRDNTIQRLENMVYTAQKNDHRDPETGRYIKG